MPRSWTRAVAVVTLALSAGAPLGAVAQAGAGERPRLRDYFTDEEIARSRRYRGPRYALGFGSTAVGLIALGAIALGPGARRASSWAGRVGGGRWWLEALLLVAFVVAAPALARLPLGVARSLHDRSFGLSTQTVPGYLGDVGKAVGIEAVVLALAALGFVGLARGLPRAWPAVAGAGAAGLVVLLVSVGPLILEPAFNRFTPVPPEVRERVRGIAARAGVRVGDVLVADASRRTTRRNAYVSGLGPTKRVVMYDTLLAASPPREVDLVVAHEFAHVAHRDVTKGTAYAAGAAAGAVLLAWALLSSGGLRSALGVAGAGDPRALPFVALALAVASVLVTPAASWISRGQEAAADRSALDYTRDAETAIAVEVALARANLSDLEPNGLIRWAFFSHPPVLERIRIALEWRRAHPDLAPEAAPP